MINYNKNLIFKKFFLDNTQFFFICLLSLSIIVWVIQAVNFLDFVTEDGHGLLVYIKPLPSLLKYPITGFDFHARQDEKGRLIIGGKFDNDSSQDKNIKDTAEKLIQDMAARLNYNGEMILDHFTLGKRPLPIDRRPKIGRLKNQQGQKLNGVYLAVMHSGITNAPLAGKLGIEEVITGKRNYLIQDFSPQKEVKEES